MRLSIRKKLILSISIPLLVTYAGLLGWDYWRQREGATREMQRLVTERAQDTAAHLDTRLASVMQSADSMANLLENRTNPTEMQLRAMLASQFRQNVWIVSAAVVLEPIGEPPRALTAQRVPFAQREPGGPGGSGGPRDTNAPRESGGPPGLDGSRDAGGFARPDRPRETGGDREPGARERFGPREPGGFRQSTGPRGAATTREAGGLGGPSGPGGPGGPGPLRGIDVTDDSNYRTHEWYVRAKADHKPAWTDPYIDAASPGQRRVCTYAVPLMADEQFHGVVAVTILTDELQQLRNRPDRGPTRLASTVPASADVAPGAVPQFSSSSQPVELSPALAAAPTGFAILNAQGQVISAPNPQADRSRSIFDLAKDLDTKELAEMAQSALAGKSGVLRVRGLQRLLPDLAADEYHWVAIAPIPATGWLFSTAISESSVMNPILSRLWQRAAFLGAGLIILMAVVLLVSIRISRPIERLAGAVDRLAAGDMDARVTGVRSHDELGRLADGFNHMTHQLKSHVAALTQQTAAREKVESELRIARKIQTDLLPRTFPPFPDRAEFDLHAINVPAAGVAGDFYDFFFTRPDLLTVVIADVAGHGVPAALLMAVTRTIVRNLANAGLSPAQIVQRANAMLIADTSDHMFVTMFLAQYEPATGKVTYVNAGHPPPLRLRPGAAPTRFGDVMSPLVGISEDALGPFDQGVDELAVGETLLLFTDGVTEARSAAGKVLTEPGFCDLLRARGTESPDDLCLGLADQLDEYQSHVRTDDLTLLALSRRT